MKLRRARTRKPSDVQPSLSNAGVHQVAQQLIAQSAAQVKTPSIVVWLHDGPPGMTGLDHVLGSPHAQPVFFGAAVNGEVLSSNDLVWKSIPTLCHPTHFSIHRDGVFLISGRITAPVLRPGTDFIISKGDLSGSFGGDLANVLTDVAENSVATPNEPDEDAWRLGRKVVRKS